MSDNIILKYNINENGEPISIRITGEEKQVSPNTLLTQLSQLPDELQGVECRKNGSLLTEIPFHRPLVTNSYKISYSTGLVYFHSSLSGATVTFDYHGRGVEMLHASRIAMEDGNVLGVETLSELIDLHEQALVSVNEIYSRLDVILEEAKAESASLVENVQNVSSQAYGDVIKHSSAAIENMTQIVSEIEDSAYTTSKAITNILKSMNNTASESYKEIEVLMTSVETLVEESVSFANAKKLEVEQNLQGVIAHFNAYIDDAFDKKEQAKEEIENKVVEFEIEKQQMLQSLAQKVDEFNAYILARKEEMDTIIDEAMSTVNNLVDIFEGHELERQAIFNDSQLERNELFDNDMESKTSDFDQTQANREHEFDTLQSEHEQEFNTAEQIRQQEYEYWRDLVLDENAITNLQQQVNNQIDEVVSEDVLELVEDENGNIVGTIGGQRLTFYTNHLNELGEVVKREIASHLISGKQSTHLGSDMPIDVEQVWFDPSDEDSSELQFPEDIALAQFQDTINQIRDEVFDIKQATKLDDLLAGTFYGEDSTSDNVDEGSSTVKTMTILVGSNIKLRQLKEGQMAYCSDTEKLYIGVRVNPVSTIVQNVAIGGTSSGDEGSGNLTGEYLELNGQDGKTYRVFIGEDGELKQREKDYYTAEEPNIDEAGVGARYKGLIVNRYYGGGEAGNGLTPLTHGFIELYNNSSNGQTFSLNGLALYYRDLDGGVWRRLKLKGYIPPQCSYLVRGAKTSDAKASTCRYEIDKFDQHWEIAFSDKSAMIYLGVDAGELTVTNPYLLSDGTQFKGYIDLMASSSEDEVRSLIALEYDVTKPPAYKKYLGRDYGVQRMDFTDKNNAYTDYEQINFRTCDMSVYKPRCVDDGEWTLYYNKTKINQNIPNLVNMQYGKEWHTRTFTWQTKVTPRGYLKYRKVGQARWNMVDSNVEIIYHESEDATVHRCIVRNLEEGLYEYQTGDEGMWSDINNFEVKSYLVNGVPDTSASIKFLHTSDQQAVFENYYDVWRWTAKYIEEHEDMDTLDFALNTGDISQSASRHFEWLSYWKYPRFLKEKPHMLVCGNNDLLSKKYSNCFKYYEANENDFTGSKFQSNVGTHDIIQGKTPFDKYASSHSFDLGYTHFVVVNSNCTASVEDPDIWIKQMNWVRQDMQQARMRPNPPRWFIMLAHHGAFTVCRMKDVQQMVPFVEDLGFHAVLCGHHHTYSRSTPIRMNIREQVEAITGRDLYEVYDGCGQAIAKAVYSIGYIETFANSAGVHIPPSGVSYDQTTEDGTNEDGSQGTVTNGNVGSRETYVDREGGTHWVMAQAAGAKLKSNKDLEKTPTPWYYGWCNYSEETGYTNNPHPYNPSYIMWDISYDAITFKSYVLTGIVEFDDILKDTSIIPSNRFNYDDVERVLIDEYTIQWKDIPHS